MMVRTPCSLFLAVLSISCTMSLAFAQGRAEPSGSNATHKPAATSAALENNTNLPARAVALHDLPGVRKSLDRGIDVKNQIAGNVLNGAAIQGDLEIVQALLERGVAQKDREALTNALAAAITNAHTARHLRIMEAVIAAGADVNWRSQGGDTLLMLAYAEPPVEETPDKKKGTPAPATTTWQVMLAHGARVNAKNDIGSTALMLAVSNGSVAMIKALIAQGANVNAKTDDGFTALSHAKLFRRPEVIDLLKKAGAKE